MLTSNNEKLELLKKFDYNIFKEEDSISKQKIVWLMLNSIEYVETLKIDLNTLCEFIFKMQMKYNKRRNPFHNFEHGVSGKLKFHYYYLPLIKYQVMQCCFAFTKSTSVQKFLSPIESFSLVFSGFCHDVGHTGHNNDFEQKSLSKLALRYHDRSVLQLLKPP